MKRKFARISLLYVPCSSERKLKKAEQVDADGIILDLEDSVSIQEKDTARENAKAAISAIKATGKEVIIRINAADTFWCMEDLQEIVPLQPHGIIVPKADVKAVQFVDLILSNLENKHDLPKGEIDIIPLLEGCRGILHGEKILGASSRITGVQLGGEDLTKELSILRTSQGEEIAFARTMLAYAACSRGVDCIDTPYTGLKDTEGLEADCRTAKNMGFTGKTCIYPDHASIIKRVFIPTKEEIEVAKKLVAAFKTALENGNAACMFEGKMVDYPIAERAEKLLSHYQEGSEER